MQNPIAAVLAAFTGSAISAGALAQQAPEPAPPPATVEIKAGADSLRRNDTASRVVVTRDELVKYGDRSVLDAMKRLPGVTVGDGGVRMRGLGGGYTQVLADGERAPSGFSLEALSPDAIERIEVIRAATAEYSTQSIAGTINIILRKTAGKDASGEFKLGHGGGAGSRSPSLALGHSGKRGGFSHTLGASLSRNEREFRSEERELALGPDGTLAELRDTHTQYHQSFQGLNANARLGWAFGQGDSLGWQTFLSDSRSRGTEDNRTRTLRGPAYPYPQLPAWFDGELTTLGTNLALARRLEGGARLDAKLGLKASRSERSLWRQGFSGAEMVLDSRDSSRVREAGAGSTGKYLLPLAGGHVLAFGWDAGRERFRERGRRSERPLAATPAINFDNGFAATVDRLAVYAQDEWNLRQGWSVYLGARWEGVRMRTTGDGFAASRARYSVFSPLAQSLWKIPGAKGDQVRLALTRTYRAPPTSRLLPTYFYTTFNTEVSPDSIGNPRLRPELATGVDRNGRPGIGQRQHACDPRLHPQHGALQRRTLGLVAGQPGGGAGAQPGAGSQAAHEDPRARLAARAAREPGAQLVERGQRARPGQPARPPAALVGQPRRRRRQGQARRRRQLQLRVGRLDPHLGVPVRLRRAGARAGSLCPGQVRCAAPAALHRRQPAGAAADEQLGLPGRARAAGKRDGGADLPQLAPAVRAEIPGEVR